MKAMEVWKDIIGYEGYYQVSSFGRVRSLDREFIRKQKRYKQTFIVRRKGIILRFYYSRARHGRGGSYAKVKLCSKGISKNREVHRLVALAFVKNTDNKPVVNHINSNSLDNRKENLEWCTVTENNRHCVRSGRKPTIFKSTFNADDRIELDKLFDLGLGVTAISSQLGLPYNAVRHIHRLRNI